MTRIQILSDLHIEFHKDRGESFISSLNSKDVDVLVLAGDIDTYQNLTHTLNLFLKAYLDSDIVVVHGNHEYYNTAIKSFKSEFQSYADSQQRLHWLNNSSTVLHGQRYLGATLWFPEDPLSVFHRNRLFDYHKIEDFKESVYQENAESVKFLTQNVTNSDIVVTHHLPSYRSVDLKFKNSPLNPFFVCPLDTLIEKAQPKYWIHGHTHTFFQYHIGETQVIANPLGYPGPEQNDFKKDFIIEV